MSISKFVLFLLILVSAAFVVGVGFAYLWGFYGPTVAIPGLLIVLFVIAMPILIFKSLRVSRESK